jgi:hypothetical protein
MKDSKALVPVELIESKIYQEKKRRWREPHARFDEGGLSPVAVLNIAVAVCY